MWERTGCRPRPPLLSTEHSPHPALSSFSTTSIGNNNGRLPRQHVIAYSVRWRSAKGKSGHLDFGPHLHPCRGLVYLCRPDLLYIDLHCSR